MFAGVTPAPAAGEKDRTRFYVLSNYYLKNGSQVARIHDYMQAVLPLANRLHSGPKLLLESLVAPHMPQYAAILGYKSLEEWWSISTKLMEDPEFRKATGAWENHDEPPYEHFSMTLLLATDYSPEITVPATSPKTPRIFELRVYHSPTSRQLRALHERFAGPEIKIFHRVGVHPILYSSTVFGPNKPNLTYVIPFDNLAEREKAWNAFGADPEWTKVRKESIDKHGQISSVIQIALYRATAYSPLR